MISLGDAGDPLRVELSPMGAAVDSIWLTERTPKGRFVHRKSAESQDPYEVLGPMKTREGEARAFATHQIWIDEPERRSWPLDRLLWRLARQSDREAVFTTELNSDASSAPILRLTRTYRLVAGKPLILMSTQIENLGDRPRTIRIAQDGPGGVQREDLFHDSRRLIAAGRASDGTLYAGRVKHRPELYKAAIAQEPVRLTPPEQEVVWVAALDKYFTIVLRPLAKPGEKSDFILDARGTVAELIEDSPQPDLQTRLVTRPLVLPAGGSQSYDFEIYAGAKDPERLAAINPAYTDRSQLNYKAIYQVDSSCCTFEPLTELMSGLLHVIYAVVRNLGLAIIVLVLIVRTLLHPLAVYQQKQMYKMQEGMARLQPKMQDIKERFANDKVKQNQEMMRLFSEENVNPAASMVAFVPLFIQMPILVALWSTLSSDVELRHAALDGYWIRDLSAPDALIKFGAPGITLPIISMLPFIGTLFTNIPSFNLLPLLMGIAMWLQQKYMPKPEFQKKAATANPAPRPAGGGLTPEEQLRQQQMIAKMMCIMFPLMFYYMPSGLCLYWMASNVYGIIESLIIRRQLRQEKERALKEGPKPPRSGGFMSRLLKRFAEQVEEVNRRADRISDRDPRRSKRNQPDRG